MEPIVEELKARIEELESLNAGLRQQVRALANPGVDEEIAEMVEEKMAAGLDRDTAIRAAKQQVAHDAQLAKEEREAKPKAASAARAAEAASKAAEKGASGA